MDTSVVVAAAVGVVVAAAGAAAAAGVAAAADKTRAAAAHNFAAAGAAGAGAAAAEESGRAQIQLASWSIGLSSTGGTTGIVAALGKAVEPTAEVAPGAEQDVETAAPGSIVVVAAPASAASAAVVVAAAVAAPSAAAAVGAARAEMPERSASSHFEVAETQNFASMSARDTQERLLGNFPSLLTEVVRSGHDLSTEAAKLSAGLAGRSWAHLGTLTVFHVALDQRVDRATREDTHLVVCGEDDDRNIGVAQDGELSRLLHDTQLALGERHLAMTVILDPRDLNLTAARGRRGGVARN
eukprot:scaffold141984_cov31-Tisochrysis_lutea.AAC.1